MEINCEHPATNLELKVKTDLHLKDKLYYLNSFYKYKKSLFEEIVRQEKLFLDMKQQYIEIEVNILDYNLYKVLYVYINILNS